MTKSIITTDNQVSEQLLIPSVQIDWEKVMERRPAILKHEDELPPYLLLPEVDALLKTVLDAADHLLIHTLWITGLRVSELLKLTPAHFTFGKKNNYVSANTLKRKKTKKKHKPRQIPLFDQSYLWELQSYIETNRLKRDQRIFNFARQSVDNKIKKVLNNAKKQGLDFPISVSGKTFRHSYAVNAILHDVPVTKLQKVMGHQRIESTMHYLKVLSGDIMDVMERVKFKL